MREIGRETDGECHECGERTNCVYRCVELGIQLIPPSHVSIPRNQNGMMAKGALLLEKLISAECVRPKRKG